MIASTLSTQPSNSQCGFVPAPFFVDVDHSSNASTTGRVNTASLQAPLYRSHTLPCQSSPCSSPRHRVISQTRQSSKISRCAPPAKSFYLPATYGNAIKIRLIGSTEPFDYASRPEVRRSNNSTSGYTFFDLSTGQHERFDEPIASFMQDEGNIIVMCRLQKHDPLRLHVAVQYELLNRNAQYWVSRWLHPENPNGGGQVYKVSRRVQHWRVQHILATQGSKVKIRYFGGHVAVVPRSYLHETMRPQADKHATRYQNGDYRPI